VHFLNHGKQRHTDKQGVFIEASPGPYDWFLGETLAGFMPTQDRGSLIAIKQKPHIFWGKCGSQSWGCCCLDED